MAKVKRIATGAFFGFLFGVTCAAQSQPARDPSAPSEEQLNVYRAFLDKIGPVLHIKNVADVTIPFDFKGFPEGRPCLKGVELESPPNYLRTTHKLGAEIIKGREIKLVDRHEQLQRLREKGDALGTGSKQAAPDEAKSSLNFLIFSEVAFDIGHRFAVLKYLWVCGEHCDSGETLVIEKIDGRWTLKPRFACATFINNAWSEMPN